MVHSQKQRRAAELVVEHCNLDWRIKSNQPADYLPPLQSWFNFLLSNSYMMEAAQLLWSPSQFNPNPEFTKSVWRLFDKTSTGLIMGAASCSKSYGMGVRLFLEWVRDPMWTTVRLIGPSEDHLETNLFSHLVSLHEQASLPLPGKVGSLFIGLNRRNLVSSIKGLVIPVGKVKKAGRLQGTKRKPRIRPHPVFGELSRLFVFLDEIENVPAGVWSDIDNVLSNLDQVDTEGLKIFGAYNPTNPTDEVGVRAEPQFGWKDFDLEKHYEWVSKRGWHVLRLDGEKSENVLQDRIVFPGLQSRAGLARIARNAGGRTAAGYLSMGRGAYPVHSVEATVVNQAVINKARGEYIWQEKPVSVGSADLALEGGARVLFSHGRFGLATGIKYPPSLEFPEGRTVMFKTRGGIVEARYGLQLDQQLPLPKGDTVATARTLIDISKKLGIRPEMLCVDRTGNGAGVHDLMKTEWSSLIHGVNYSSSTTTMKVMLEDEKAADEEYDRIDTELWFALAAWMEFRALLINPAVDMTQLSDQLPNRRYRVVAGRRKVESKKDYRTRLGKESPDEADSLTLFVHAVRLGRQHVPSMEGFSSATGFTPEDDDWWDGDHLENGTRFDAASVTDVLEVA